MISDWAGSLTFAHVMTIGAAGSAIVVALVCTVIEGVRSRRRGDKLDAPARDSTDAK